jgi:hypothetical protein
MRDVWNFIAVFSVGTVFGMVNLIIIGALSEFLHKKKTLRELEYAEKIRTGRLTVN